MEMRTLSVLPLVPSMPPGTYTIVAMTWRRKRPVATNPIRYWKNPTRAQGSKVIQDCCQRRSIFWCCSAGRCSRSICRLNVTAARAKRRCNFELALDQIDSQCIRFGLLGFPSRPNVFSVRVLKGCPLLLLSPGRLQKEIGARVFAGLLFKIGE